jgi:hypothetical protein
MEHNVKVDNNNVHINGMYSGKEIGEILEAVSATVPDLLMKLWRILYSKESAQEMGQAVGSLYKELVEAGIPKENALKMTSDYMFSLKEMARNAFEFGNAQTKEWHNSNK